MKYKLLLIILTLISCNTEPKKSVELRINSNGIEIKESTKTEGKINCALSELKKTIEYENEFKKYKEYSGDTLITFDKKYINGVTYKTIFDLRVHEQYVWFLNENENKSKTDSLLIHYEDIVEYYIIIQSEFDLSQCEIIITEIENYSIEGEQKTNVKRIKI